MMPEKCWEENKWVSKTLLIHRARMCWILNQNQSQNEQNMNRFLQNYKYTLQECHGY